MQEKTKTLHFIGIAKGIVHDLALSLYQGQNTVTASYDASFDPASSRLKIGEVLFKKLGWFSEKITSMYDAVIVGTQVQKDNPELKEAQKLGLKIYSYPEYIYACTKDKQRIVITGHHGKAMITAMVIHVLDYWHRAFDYVAHTSLQALKTQVKLSDAPIIIIEGVETPTSYLDLTPEFLHYRHNIALINDITLQHANTEKTVDECMQHFDTFADASPKGGTLLYCEENDWATIIGSKERTDVITEKYTTHPHECVNEQTYLITKKEEKIFVPLTGQHHMQQVSGAKKLLKNIGIVSEQFYEAMAAFKLKKFITIK